MAERFPALADARTVAFAAFFAALVPPAPLDVNAWAATAPRYVSPESGSPEPGQWDASKAPHLVELQECLSADHPATDVAFLKSAQISGSEAGLNLIGATVHNASPTRPRPTLVVLPTIDEGKKYNKVKLQPTIDATPDLRRRIASEKSRDAESSTGSFKRFANGFLVVTGANSSTGLQMISAHTIVLEEVSEYPLEAGERGDPVDQILVRAAAWETYRPKRYYVSTPGTKGSCRITQIYERSDQRRRYVPCPHCGQFQQLRFPNLRWAETAPRGAHFVCQAPACGRAIEHRHKDGMLDAGVWIPTFVDRDGVMPPIVIAPADVPAWRARDREGRQPGFALWKAYSKLSTWDGIAEDFEATKDQPRKLKTFVQQTLGEAWEERGDAPPAELLMQRREAFPARRVPAGVLSVTVTVDVQGNRLEWYAWGWGVGLSSWLIDRGIVVGDPADQGIWRGLDPLVLRTWEDGRGNLWQADAIGVDAGYLAQQVYAWCLRHAATGRVFALDGRAGWRLPAIGTPKKMGVDHDGKRQGSILLWPVGTADLKAEHYAGLRKTIEGPSADGVWPIGAVHLNELVDREMADQLTAETLASRDLKNGLAVREWVKTAHRANEALDCAVYGRALAHHLTDSLMPEDWAALAARRNAQPDLVQRDLAALWAPPLPAVGTPAAGAPVGTGAGEAGVAVAGDGAAAAPAAAPARTRGVRGRVVH